jgi:hypothetical protein
MALTSAPLPSFCGIPMDRSKFVAIATGAISLFLGLVYLVVVQFLDSRTMIPAPIELLLALVHSLNYTH